MLSLDIIDIYNRTLT